jgi:mono/diheme cytochrome c family protein
LQQKILIGLVLTLFIVVFIPAYWATESSRQEAARQRLLSEAIERGSELYVTQCAACHGAGGQGGVGSALRGTQLPGDALAKTITRGIPGTAMPAFGAEEGGPLKEHQIADLVTFIKNWEKAASETAEAAAEEPGPEAAPQATPDAIALYKANCAACHGPARQGIPQFAPALTPESLDSLTDAEIRKAIADGVAGTAMLGFGDRLGSEEIDALVQFLKNTQP